MISLHGLVARDDSKESMDPTMQSLLVALLVLVVFAVVLVGALFLLRRVRNARKQAELPLYEKRQSNHRRLTITTSGGKGRDSVVVYSEKADLMNSPTSPSSPVPEIRITFPDEVDAAGKHQSGRVVVVNVGEHSVGLEPLHEDDLPPYQRYESLDLDRIGGLKEKHNKDQYS